MTPLSMRRPEQKTRAEQALLYAQMQQPPRSRELAATAISQLQNDPELSVLLSSEAVRVKKTAQAEEALRQSLLALRSRAVLRNRGRSSPGFRPGWQARRYFHRP